MTALTSSSELAPVDKKTEMSPDVLTKNEVHKGQSKKSNVPSTHKIENVNNPSYWRGTTLKKLMWWFLLTKTVKTQSSPTTVTKPSNHSGLSLIPLPPLTATRDSLLIFD